MDKLALVLAVAAVVLAGWTALGAGDGTNSSNDERLESLDASVSELTASVQSLEKRLGELPAPDMVANTDGSGADAAGLDGNAARAPTLSERLSEIEKSVEDQGARLAEMKVESDKTSQPPRFYGRNSTFYRNADDAAKQLDLDAGQRAQMDRVIESTKRELDDLYNLPNDDGTTWNEIKKISLTKFSSGDAGDGIVALTSNFAKIAKFKNTKIPGSNEKYGEAETRIKNLAKESIGATLNPDQKKKWDNAHTDHLVGGGASSSMTFSSVVLDTDDK